MAFHAGGQVCQHLGDAAVLPICCNTVHAVRRFRLGFQLVFQGVQFVQRLFVVGGSIGQLRHLYGVLQQLGRHMVLVARVQKHPVQLGQVRRDHPPHIVLVSCVPCTSGNIPASRHRCLHGVARVGPRRALPFQPLPVGLAGCPDDSLRLCKAIVPRFPRLFVQRVHHPTLDAAAVQVQVLVDPLAQHPRHTLIGHTLAHRRADDLHRQVGPCFFVTFAKVVFDLRPDRLPYLCDAVQLVRRSCDFRREQSRILVRQFLIQLVNAPRAAVLRRRQLDAVPAQLLLRQGIAAILIHHFLVLRPAPLHMYSKIVQVFVFVPQAAVPPGTLLQNPVSNALCSAKGCFKVCLSAGHVLHQTIKLLCHRDFVCLAGAVAQNAPGQLLHSLHRYTTHLAALV